MRRELHVRFCEGGGVQFPSATRLVVLARWMGPRIVAWLERTLEQDLRLTVNRTKTQVVRLHGAKTSLNFLGFTLRYDRDRFGRERRYLNVVPSKRALARVRDKLRDLTSRRTNRSLVETIGAVNTLLRGWAAYFRYGYPRAAFRAGPLLDKYSRRVYSVSAPSAYTGAKVHNLSKSIHIRRKFK